jgi:hypothetical protein
MDIRCSCAEDLKGTQHAPRVFLDRRRRNRTVGFRVMSAWTSTLEVETPMKSRLTMLALACLVAPGAPAVLAAMISGAAAQIAEPSLVAPRWAVFSEPGTAVDYPANVFSVEAGPSPRGTGHRLQTDDGRAEFMLYVSPNEDRDSPRSYVRKYLAVPKAKLDYTRITDRFFVVSGVQEGRVFYSRCNYPRGPSGPMHCVYLLYPEAETRAWDGIVTRISRSLRPAG